LTFGKKMLTLQPKALNMSSDKDLLIKLQTRVRQLIFKLNEVEEENARLQDLLRAKDDETTILQQQLAKAKGEFEHLKLARMMELSFGDLDSAKSKLTKLIKDVEKSIILLNAE